MTVKPFVAYREVSNDYLHQLDDEARRILFNDMKESAVRELAQALLESGGCRIEVNQLLDRRYVRFDLTVYVETNHNARDHAGNYIPPENRRPQTEAPYTLPLPDGRIATSNDNLHWTLPEPIREATRLGGHNYVGYSIDDLATPITTGTELAIRATNRDRDFSPWDVVAADSPVVRDMQDSIRRLRATSPAPIQAWVGNDTLTWVSGGTVTPTGDMAHAELTFEGVPIHYDPALDELPPRIYATNSAFDHLDAAHEAQIRDDIGPVRADLAAMERYRRAAETTVDSNPPT